MRNFWGTLRSDMRKTEIGTGGRSTDLELATNVDGASVRVAKTSAWSYDEPIEGYKTKFKKYTYYRTTTLLDADHLLETTITLLDREFHEQRTEVICVSTGERKQFNPLDLLDGGNK